ncbi:MAG: putative bifunctional diguanylate cyclase/phosphodiesterase [Acidimicrobiales bacterium]
MAEGATRFRTLALGGLVLLAGTSVAAGFEGLPSPVVLAIFASLAIWAENNQVDLSTNVTVSPHVLLVSAAIVAFDGHGAILGAAACGAAGGLVVAHLRRHKFAVAAYNTAQFGLSAAAAAGAYQLLLVGTYPAIAGYLLVPVAYVCANAVLVLAGVSWESGLPVAAVWRDIRPVLPLDLVFGILGVLLGRLYVEVSPLAAVGVLAPAVLALAVYQLLSTSRGARTQVEALYKFTQELEGTGGEEETAASVLHWVRELVRVGVAEMTVVGPEGWTRLTSQGDGLTRSEGSGRPVEVEAMVTGPLIGKGLAADSPLRRQLDGRQFGEAMLAPLRIDNTLVGTLTVADRRGGAAFTRDDLRLLETLASHAAISLNNAKLVDRLRWDSTHDRLTGLTNRDHFGRLVADVPTSCAVLLVDLDRFKEINDTLGHGCGDSLLRAVAERMRQRLVGDAVVARMGGDEFGILMPGTGSGDAAQAAVELLTTLEQPFEVDGLQLEVTASVGVAIGNGEPDPAKLLQQADVAMYSAKAAHSGWEMYSADRDHHDPRRLGLASELRRAIRGGEIEVYFQPKARLSSVCTCGVEALARWAHPRYGILGPDSFIPVAEHAGLIKALTMFVLKQAVAQHRELRRLGFDLGVAVNLSVRSVLDVNLPDQVGEVILAHGMPPADLTLEITESSIMADPGRTIGILGRLSDMGVQIALDDFGTGYSSLSYLKRLPVNEVKIDRSFTVGILTNEKDEAIVRSTIDLSHHLGLRVIAEGVEDGATWSRLRDLGCDQAQGYFVSPPLSSGGLVRWLQRSPNPIDLMGEPHVSPVQGWRGAGPGGAGPPPPKPSP